MHQAFVLGLRWIFTDEKLESLYVWINRWQEAASAPLAPLPDKKVFKPKNDLPVLDNYKGGAPDCFWAKFPVNIVQPAPPLVNADRLMELALEAGFDDLTLLEAIVFDLKNGAKIGCKGEFRNPSKASNAPSVFENDNGRRVTDAIASWVKNKYVYGPVNLEDVPRRAKFAGLMAREKPNGSVRIIQNLSAPKGASVNEGIAACDYPAKMSSTNQWIRALNKAGRSCKFCKVDWSDAYKHITVDLDDTDLQWFMWLDKAFKELCLIFGGVSSAGLYNRLAALVIFIVRHRSGIDRDLVIQHLDDCCAAAPADSLVLERFDAEYFWVAEQLGIKLAPRDDPEKSFGPSTQGTVLGIRYDTVQWRWSLPEEKMSRLLHTLEQLLGDTHARQDQIWSVVGKVLNVMPLVPTGRFNVDHLIRANNESKEKAFKVALTDKVKRQLRFWRQIIPTCAGMAGIPRVEKGQAPWTIQVFTDAAGGSISSKGHGVGAVAVGWWSYLPWSKPINSGQLVKDGTDRQLDRLLSAWELVGPLLALSGGMARFRGFPVKIWVDNIGSVCIWKKGYSSSCRICSTIVKAIASLEATFGCQVVISKITRCSEPMAVMADCLSKAAFHKFWEEAYKLGGLDLDIQPAAVSKELLDWIQRPCEDDDLGDRLVKEILSSNPGWAPPCSF